MAATALLAGNLAAAVKLPDALPPHPRLLFASNDLPAIQKRIETQSWAKSRFAALKAEADGWIERDLRLPDRGGQWYHYYSCPKHGARLRTESATRHVCPIDKEVLTGYPYDDVVITGEHDRLASGLRTLGIVFQLTKDPRYAAKGRGILLAYADRYESYPLHNTRGEPKVGGGKVGPQTLDESTWLIDMVEGADCIWDTLSSGEQQHIADKLVRPAVQVIRDHRMGIHNIQCWKNSAVGLAGLLLGDMKLVDEALHAESGYFKQMEKGVNADGPWYEGAWGYHFYTVSAVTHLTEGAFHSGIQLYGPEFKRMFDAPVAMAAPNLELPAFNDSHTVRLAGSASLYEIAFARYADARYCSVLGRSSRISDESMLNGVADVGKADELTLVSTNFVASGNAILAAGRGPKATWLCLDYGPHGGGHGHPDKLGFVLHSGGRVIANDPGTANYGVPIQGGWYRTTLAHNTLTVDEASQKPAEGQCVAFLATNDCSAVLASAGKIADGVQFHRAVALLGTNLLLFVDLVDADREHTFDLAYHNVGKVNPPAGAQGFTPPNKPGYSYLRDVRKVDSADGIHLSFESGPKLTTRWSMAGGEQTTFLVGTGVGAHTEDRVPIVIARRNAKSTAMRWALQIGSGPVVRMIEEPVRLVANSKDSGAVPPGAVRLVRGEEIVVLLANPSGATVAIAHDTTNARLALWSGRTGANLKLTHAAVP